MKNKRRDFLEDLYEDGLISLRECSEEENKKYRDLYEDQLPDDIVRKTAEVHGDEVKFFQYTRDGMSENEILLSLMLKIEGKVRTIEFIMVVSVILSVIAAFLAFVK